MISLQLLISGLVQGVGYREALRREAQRLRVTGWVCNRRDGSVEAMVQGEVDPVEKLIDWARRGPIGSRVDAVRVTAVENALRFSDFERRPTT